MKKILIILLMIIGMSSGKLFAQTSSDIYIVGTSVYSPIKPVTGFNRLTLPLKSYHRNPSISFSICSKEKDYLLDFFHLDYKRAPNDIFHMPLTKLSDLNAIDVDEFIKTHDKAQALKWFQAAYESGKKIWIIDRNDFYKSLPAIAAPDRMKLIPVEIFAESLPNPRILD